LPARRILVIDDHVDVAIGLKYFLESGSREVAIAHDGARGIALALEFQPHVVICDLGLPGEHDGFSVARLIRAAPSLESLYLVALSGAPAAEAQSRALTAGFDLYLTKPVELAQLDEIMDRHPGNG